MSRVKIFYIVVTILLTNAVFVKARDPKCTMRLDGGQCRTVTRYRFDPDNLRCVPFDYKGEGGNGNNFNMLGDCQTRCVMDRPLAIAFQLGR